MIYASVCSGIEAASVAWEPMGWTPAFFAEIEPFPSAVLAHRYPEISNHGDFTKIGADAGPVDLLVGGTPCQSFSIAGKRAGLDDPRGNLALEFLGLARRLRARWIVWENVPGVLSSYSGEPDSEDGVRRKTCEIEPGIQWDQDHDLATFLTYVQECGYGFAYRVLDAQYVRTQRFPRALPQRRRRIILVGHLGDWRRAAAVLFEPESLRGDPPPRRKTRQEVAAGPGESTGGIEGRLIAYGGGNSQPINVAASLAVHGVRQDFEVETFVCFDLRGREGGSVLEGPHDTANLRAADGGSSRSYVAGPSLVRRLMPVECERLMGFSDGYTAIPWRGKSADQCPDGPRYKALGNSMPVSIMDWVGRRIDAMEAI